jgi:hypothetical protein
MENGPQSKKLHFRADGQLIADMEVGTDGAFARRARDGEWASKVEAKGSFLVHHPNPFDRLRLCRACSSGVLLC